MLVVTSFSAKGFTEYGHRFMESFARYWPSGVQLVVYSEDVEAGAVGHGIPIVDLFSVEAFRRWQGAHGDDPLLAGKVDQPCWKAKDRADGYSFRTDANKFSRKVFAIAHAARMRPGGVMAWVDADSFAFAPVPSRFAEKLLDGNACAYLGRDGAYSECGFLAFQLPEAAPLIEAWQAYYTQGTFRQFGEWHDSYLFDRAREVVPGVRCRNISPGGRGHVWVRSPLGKFMDHCKGDRKAIGFSPERRGMA